MAARDTSQVSRAAGSSMVIAAPYRGLPGDREPPPATRSTAQQPDLANQELLWSPLSPKAGGATENQILIARSATTRCPAARPFQARIWTPQARGSRGGANRVATSNGQRVYRLSRAPVGVGAPPRSRIPSCKGDFVTGAALGTWREG